jgi:hypothetical protein
MAFEATAMRMDPPLKCLGTLQMSMMVRIQRDRVSGDGLVDAVFLAGFQGLLDFRDY